MPNVFIVGHDHSVSRMFSEKGWSVVPKITSADLVVFTGGADVCPALYGEKPHRTTHYSLERDVYEIEYFTIALFTNKPMVGICRGGQFLNVMCGGKLYQHVDNHAIRGTHRAYRMDEEHDKVINVTSTHHQMMMPTDDAFVLMRAEEVHIVRTYDNEEKIRGIESVLYHRQNCLCFQPHPEFHGADETRNVFFSLIKKYLKVGE